MDGGESQGRVAPGDPELLKKADISLMYFTEAEQECEGRERETEEGDKRNLGHESRFRDVLTTLAAFKNSFKKVQIHWVMNSLSFKISTTI